MRCLLIDDDIPTVEALRDVMEWRNYGFTEVMAAHNIQDAKLQFEIRVPDLIICDIEMPRGSGLDMIKWVRESGHDCGFIFFTCHESFDFASTAIAYRANSYLIKPFDKHKLDAALLQAVEAIKRTRRLDEYSKLGETWLKNKDLVERSFWNDILTGTIAPKMDLIQVEIGRRQLSLSADCTYVLFLVSVMKSEIGEAWADSTFLFALRNLSSDILFGRPNHDRVIPYQSDNRYYLAIIADDQTPTEQLQSNGERLVRLCKQYLKCTVTSYISEEKGISELAHARIELEQLDVSNIIFRGSIHFRKNRFQYDHSTERYALDIELFMQLFVQKDKAQIVNRLKQDLELLKSQNKLDSRTLLAIREDFVQTAYSHLAQHNVQAHRLFSDDVAQQLFQKSDISVFEFMKWAHYITEKSIDTVKEALRSEGIVEQAKRFIQAHYHQDLSREDVAASVFLTPDYFSQNVQTGSGNDHQGVSE